MGKTTNTPTTHKQPKTIEVKLLVPYALIVALIFTSAAFIGGWHTSQQYEHNIDTAYARGLASKGQQ